MMRVGAVDPGKRHNAYAVAENGALCLCGLWQDESARELFYKTNALQLDRLVIEKPRVYAGKAKGDNNDLIEVSIRAGAIGAGCEMTLFVVPSRWKGQKSKTVTRKQAKAELSVAELAIVERKLSSLPSKRHNDVWDAIGILLWGLGRLGK